MTEQKKPTLYINPPPRDGNCECCGKSTKELKPFGKEGDPLVGNFDGAYLVKTFRTMGPRDEELDKQIKKIKDWNKLFETNKKKAERLSFYDQIVGTVGSSWECRNCIILDDPEYFKMKFEGEIKGDIQQTIE